ncbi:hypothetical protein Tco_1035320, partial [Tanacetum coccineum]
MKARGGIVVDLASLARR